MISPIGSSASSQIFSRSFGHLGHHHHSFSVSEALYELMLNEAVLVVYGFPDAIVGADSKTQHVDLEHGFYKMENIGFEVGQRWIER